MSDFQKLIQEGVALYEKGQWDEAIAVFSKALSIAVNNTEKSVAYNNRGNTYNEKGEHDRAIANHNKAIELNPKEGEGYSNRGVAYNNKGEHDRAIVDHNKAIELNPKGAISYNNRGVAYSSKGEYDRAIADYDKALELDPNDKSAIHNRAVALAFKSAKEQEREIKGRFGAFIQGEEFERREKEYQNKLTTVEDKITVAFRWLIGVISVAAVAALITGYLFQCQTGEFSFFGLLPFVLLAALISSPFAWRVRMLMRDKQKYEMLREDYFRKRVLAGHAALANENKEFQNQLILESVRHFSTRGGADLLLTLATDGKGGGEPAEKIGEAAEAALKKKAK
jgi:regulator of sirC expression with transglutaminase-like and TPR domain